MTQCDNQSMFLSLEVPKGHFTCVVPSEGRGILTKFSKAYQSNIEVQGPIGLLSDVTTADQLEELIRPLHGEPLIIRYARGGSAFLDYNDDSAILILPNRCVEIVRITIDVAEAYQIALEERQIWDNVGVASAAAGKFDELLRFAIRN